MPSVPHNHEKHHTTNPPTRRWPRRVPALLAALALGACATAPRAPVTEGGVGRTPTPAATAEQLEAQGHYGLAARRYLQRAQGLAPPERQRWQIRAAAVLLRAGRSEEAGRLLEAVSPEGLIPPLRLRRDLLYARWYLAQGRPGRALGLTNALFGSARGEPALMAELYRTQAEAALALHNAMGAIRALIRRERFLVDEQEIRRNQQDLWSILESSPAEQLRLERELTSDPVLRGWIDLALLQIDLATSPYRLSEAVGQWRQQYPRHPASATLLFALSAPAPAVPRARPARVALLLPLSSRFERAAAAFRDGFDAMHNADDDPDRPAVTLYDVGGDPELIDTFYDAALKDGAQMVIGPLGQQLVERLGRRDRFPVPTLLLGLSRDGEGKANLYQFSLAPEEEARRAAERAFLDGHRQAVFLFPDTPWGRRMQAAYETHWRTLGGVVLGSEFYGPRDSDHSRAIKRLFNLDDSERRARRLEGLLRVDLQFEPRRRQDIHCVFLAADPAQARLLKPEINFHHGYGLPVYATSHAYGGRPDPVNDADLDGLVLGDMPWMLLRSGRIQSLRDRLQGDWPARHTPLDRLYAFGMDAYALIRQLPRLAADPLARYAGVTSGLSLDRQGRLRRELVWARFEQGVPRPLDAYYTPMDEEEDDALETPGRAAPSPAPGPAGGGDGAALPAPAGTAPAGP